MPTVRKRVLYTGRVQGVGFRYAARAIAGRFAVAGHVRNLPDGRVELAAEGEADEVAAFLDAVAEHWSGSLTDVSERDEPPEDTAGFSVRH
jgi:acylphosphatase